MNAVAAVATMEPRGMLAPQSPTPGELLRFAIEQKADLAYLRELMALEREWRADQARMAYDAAMADFKAEPLMILKDKHVSYRNKTGGLTEYDHATIGNVVTVVTTGLGRHGFSHHWIPEQKDGRVSITCVIRHRSGHSERTTLNAAPDESGGKNSIQAMSSAVTYLERYTLLAATGIATVDQEDDDGRGGQAEKGRAQPDKSEPILSAELQDLIDDLNAKADEGLDALTAAWAAMSPAARTKVGARFGAVKKRAEAAGP